MAAAMVLRWHTRRSGMCVPAGGGLAQGLGIRLFAFGGAYWPLAKGKVRLRGGGGLGWAGGLQNPPPHVRASLSALHVPWGMAVGGWGMFWCVYMGECVWKATHTHTPCTRVKHIPRVTATLCASVRALLFSGASVQDEDDALSVHRAESLKPQKKYDWKRTLRCALATVQRECRCEVTGLKGIRCTWGRSLRSPLRRGVHKGWLVTRGFKAGSNKASFASAHSANRANRRHCVHQPPCAQRDIHAMDGSLLPSPLGICGGKTC